VRDPSSDNDFLGVFHTHQSSVIDDFSGRIDD
jgi:hypothetical protein